MKQSIGDKTRERILNAGLALWPNISVSAVADQIDMTHAAILYHFPNNSLKNAIAEHAVRTGNSRVIVSLLSSNHPAVKNITVKDRLKHFKSI